MLGDLGADGSAEPADDADAAGSSGGSASLGSTVANDGRWRIVLATISGENAMQRAEATLPRLREQTDLTAARVERREDGAAIVYGEYDNPESERAQEDLRRIRGIEVRGVRVFGRAFLAPPEAGRAGGDPELNLANVREEHGEDALYTLQVAVYESDDRRQAMRAAEEAARTYRRDGEEAFYYHGPNRSMVTIGVFGEEDYDPQSGEVSRRVRALRERHPNHLYNGRGVRETGPDGQTRLQRSRLVRIP